MNHQHLESYFRSQQVSLQWLPVLRAMAFELSGTAQAEDLRRLFFKIGGRFAHDVQAQFIHIKTLTELQEDMNVFWTQINWGWVDFADTENAVNITHQAAPLAEAFGDESLGWSVGLLEGFYQNILSVLGASSAMKVRDYGESDAMMIRLRFGLDAE